MGWVVNAMSRPFYPPEKRTDTHYTGGWVGPRADQDGCGKSRPHGDSIPRTVEPVASGYTNETMPAGNDSRKILLLRTGPLVLQQAVYHRRLSLAT